MIVQQLSTQTAQVFFIAKVICHRLIHRLSGLIAKVICHRIPLLHLLRRLILKVICRRYDHRTDQVRCLATFPLALALAQRGFQCSGFGQSIIDSKSFSIVFYLIYCCFLATANSVFGFLSNALYHLKPRHLV